MSFQRGIGESDAELRDRILARIDATLPKRPSQDHIEAFLGRWTAQVLLFLLVLAVIILYALSTAHAQTRALDGYWKWKGLMVSQVLSMEEAKAYPDCCPDRDKGDPQSWDCEAVKVGECCRFIGPYVVKRVTIAQYRILERQTGKAVMSSGSSHVNGNGAWYYESYPDLSTCKKSELRS